MFDATFLCLHLPYLTDEQFERFTLNVNKKNSIFPKQNNYSLGKNSTKSEGSFRSMDTTAKTQYKRNKLLI